MRITRIGKGKRCFSDLQFVCKHGGTSGATDVVQGSIRHPPSIVSLTLDLNKWCPGAESNHRHCNFQSHALPTELPGRARAYRGDSGPCPAPPSNAKIPRATSA